MLMSRLVSQRDPTDTLRCLKRMVTREHREENAKLFEKVDQMVREKKTADEILDFTDKELLQKGMGFSETETKMARSIWYKLMGRRLNRETLEKAAPEEKGEIKKAVARVKQLNFFDVLQQYPGYE